MMLTDYLPCVGAGTLLFVQTDQIHGVACELGELPVVMALWGASDAERFEVVLNLSVHSPDCPKAACPDCDSTGCAACLHRGWIPLEVRQALQVFSGGPDGLESSRILLDVDADGPHIAEVSDSAPTGPLVDWLSDQALKPRGKVSFADLVVVWQAMGLPGRFL